MPTLVRTLPDQLRCETLLFLHSHLISAVPMFSRAPRRFIEAIVTRLHTRLVMKGEYVVRQGEASHEMWFVSKGSVEILRRKQGDGRPGNTGAGGGGGGGGGEENSVGVLDEGAFFGEIGLLFGEKRSASVRALENSELCSLSKHQLDRALELFPDTAREIMEVANKRRHFDTENDFMLDFAAGLLSADKQQQQTAKPPNGANDTSATGVGVVRPGTSVTEMRVIAIRDRKDKEPPSPAAGGGGAAGLGSQRGGGASGAPISGGGGRFDSDSSQIFKNLVSLSGVQTLIPNSPAAATSAGAVPPSPQLGAMAHTPNARRATNNFAAGNNGFGTAGAIGSTVLLDGGGGGGGSAGLADIFSQLEFITATLSRLSERLTAIERHTGKISDIKHTIDQLALAQTEAAHLARS